MTHRHTTKSSYHTTAIRRDAGVSLASRRICTGVLIPGGERVYDSAPRNYGEQASIFGALSYGRGLLAVVTRTDAVDTPLSTLTLPKCSRHACARTTWWYSTTSTSTRRAKSSNSPGDEGRESYGCRLTRRTSRR